MKGWSNTVINVLITISVKGIKYEQATTDCLEKKILDTKEKTFPLFIGYAYKKEYLCLSSSNSSTLVYNFLLQFYNVLTKIIF